MTHALCSTLVLKLEGARACMTTPVRSRPPGLAEYNPQLSLGPPSLKLYYEQGHSLRLAANTCACNWENQFVLLVIGLFLNIASAELRVVTQRRRFFFYCFISFSHCRNVLHKGVDIEVGLKHTEDEFSFQIVKLASLQERTT